jgi:hypothetical protein
MSHYGFSEASVLSVACRHFSRTNESPSHSTLAVELRWCVLISRTVHSLNPEPKSHAC